MKKIIKKKSPLTKRILIKKNIRKNLKNKTKNKKKQKFEKKKSFIEEKEENTYEDNIYIKILIRTIFNAREARRQLKFLGIDFKSISSKVDDAFIKSCCDILNQIDKTINSKNYDHRKKKDIFFQLTKEYYRLMPHIFPFPDYSMYLINDIEKIKREICLLELTKSYFELENVFQKIKLNKEENDLNNSMYLNDSINLSINNSENLNEETHKYISNLFLEKALSEFDLSITVIKNNSKKFKEIKDFVDEFSSIKGGPFPSLELLQLFKLSKIDEEIDEKNLFFYGCETVHFYSILKNGLRLPFKEAPKNAFVYGKGILMSNNPYNQIKKCLPKNNIVYLFICNVDMLKPKRVHLHHKNYPEKLRKEFNSIVINQIKYHFEDGTSNYGMDFIFYDTSLIQLCYIVKLQIP